MKNLIFCISLVVVLATFEYTSAQQYFNTSNSCFAVQGYYLSGTEITRVQISSNASCCDFCRALKNCVAWYLNYYTPNTAQSACYLYSNITGITYDTTYPAYYSSGLISTSPFWKCTAENDIWYYDSSLGWTKQSLTTQSACCDRCFDLLYKNKCKSWMFNKNTNECYFSTLDYKTKVGIYFAGMVTGNTVPAFERPINKDFMQDFDLNNLLAALPSGNLLPRPN